MEEGQHLAGTLLALPPEAREAWLRQHPEVLSYHAFTALVQGVATAMGCDPLDAVALSELVVRHVDRVPVPPDAHVVHLMLRINAWKERGNTLRNIAELDDAERAYDTGLALARSNPALIVEEAVMKRGLALIAHDRGDHERAVRMIREGVPVFQAVHDRLQVLRSRLLEGYVEYGAGHDTAALDIFEATLELSRELGDEATRARSHVNAAHAARRIGVRDRALAHFAAGAELLERCGLTAETIRAEWGLVLLEAGDRPADILPALDRIRDRFLATGRKGDAAWVSLDVVMLLRDGGRDEEGSRLAISLVEFFAKHGLRAEAMRALAELRDAAVQGTLSTELLREIQERLRKLC